MGFASVKIEIVASCQFQDLGHLRHMSEIIGQPANVRRLSKMFPEVALPQQEGTGDRLTGGEVGITLCPHPPNRFEASLFHIFFHLFK